MRNQYYHKHRQTLDVCGVYTLLHAALIDPAAAAQSLQWLVVKPGTRFHYSNLGFALLGRALGHAAGSSYESLVMAKILRPLGMASATFDTPSSLSGVAVGFRPSGAVGILDHSDGWGAPAGDLLVSASDMAKWMSLWARRSQRGPKRVARGDADPVAPIIDGATLDEMLQPVVEMRDGRSAIGKPWEFLYSRGQWLKSKQGGDPGYRSSLTLCPALNLGVFISALTDPVAENSVYTIPVVDILAPVRPCSPHAVDRLSAS
jgi:CubicO group peptidase (beta-lactamase class C family)